MIFRQVYFYFLSFFKTHWALDYDGEFGYELISVLPFAYWLHKKGKYVDIVTSKDMKRFYYFANNVKERYQERCYKRVAGVPVCDIHRRWMNTWLWEAPPLKEIYKNDRFKFEKPILIICNKYNMEWGFPPISFLSNDVLDVIMSRFKSKYQIIYCRPMGGKIADDNSVVYDLNDHAFIRENHPEVILIESLHDQNNDLTFNELQLLCFANADHFISVQGGYAIFCSYFKGTNIVYGARSKQRTAEEIMYKSYDRWYQKFSGAKVMYCDNYDTLLNTVNERY